MMVDRLLTGDQKQPSDAARKGLAAARNLEVAAVALGAILSVGLVIAALYLLFDIRAWEILSGSPADRQLERLEEKIDSLPERLREATGSYAEGPSDGGG